MTGFVNSEEFSALCASYGIESGSGDWSGISIPILGNCSWCGTDNDTITDFVTRLYRICLASEPDEAGLAEAQRRRLFERGPRWKRAIVIAAGPLMNFVLAVALYAAAGAIGVEDIAPYVAAKPGTQAEAQGVAPMDRVIAVEGERIEGISDFNLARIERAGEPAVTITLARAGTAAAETGAKIDLAQPGDRADEN